MARSLAESHRKIIMETLLMAGVPLTSNEIGQRCGLRGDRVQKRMAELERSGAVHRGPIRRCAVGLFAHEWSVRAAMQRVPATVPQPKPIAGQMDLPIFD